MQTMFVACLEDRGIILPEYILEATGGAVETFGSLLEAETTRGLYGLFGSLRQHFNGDLLGAPPALARHYRVENPSLNRWGEALAACLPLAVKRALPERLKRPVKRWLRVLRGDPQLPWNNNPRKLPSADDSGGTAARISVSHTGSRTAPRHQCPNADCGPGQTCIRATLTTARTASLPETNTLYTDSANAPSLVLFLARPRAGAAGVETPSEAAPRTDEACSAPLPGASPPGCLVPVATSSLHAGNHFWKLGSTGRAVCARRRL